MSKALWNEEDKLLSPARKIGSSRNEAGRRHALSWTPAWRGGSSFERGLPPLP